MGRKLAITRLAAPLALVAMTAVPIASAAPPDFCATRVASAKFAAWGDMSSYVLADGGTMEDPLLWTLGSSASFAAENEPFALNSRTDKKSLRLSNGQTAIAKWRCVGDDYPTMRFVVRNAGNVAAALRIDVQLGAGAGVALRTTLANITAGPKWAPSAIIKVPTGLVVAGHKLRFTAVGAGADFRVDNVYIDPMRVRA